MWNHFRQQRLICWKPVIRSGAREQALSCELQCSQSIVHGASSVRNAL